MYSISTLFLNVCIVIINGKIVWKVAWIGYFLRLKLSSRRYQLLGALIHFNFIILILICFWLMMSGVNYVIYGCSSARTTPEVSLYRSFLTLEKNIIAVITQNREIDDNLERQIKNQILCTCRLFLLLFNILAISQKYFSFYPPSLLAAS